MKEIFKRKGLMMKKQSEEENMDNHDDMSEDPFRIYSLLKKKDKVVSYKDSEFSMKYPSGFTPNKGSDGASMHVEEGRGSNSKNGNEGNVDVDNAVPSGNHSGMNSKEGGTESVCSGYFKKSEVPRTGGSILSLLDDVVKVGQVMGYKMDGCLAQKAKKDWVKELCVKNKVNFLALQETKMENMELFCVKTCWGNMAFDYVHSDSVGANVFNSFISSAGLVEVSLGGCSFTWCHKSATKMSKLDRFFVSESLLDTCPNISAITLERYLSDHRPILLCEYHFDYGPTPFRFFHYWFEMEGFSKIIEDAWKESPSDESNAMISMMGKLKFLKTKIREWNKTNMLCQKNFKAQCKADLEAVELNSLEIAQKAKVKWAIEGDENSSFFHGMLNKKWNTLSIRGIMVDGIWIDDPNLVKREFLMHFSSRFSKPNNRRALIQMRFPKRLSLKQQVELESEVSNEEIKRAVWDCGSDKAPGPDGFTFGFYRYFWYLIENDVYNDVKYFFMHGEIPKGCNSSFIALIPKIPDANLVKDFRPISLIGSLYKIIAKILANRLVGVLGDIVNEVQSAFIADRQILDGPFILDELIQWCKSSRGSIILNGSPTEEFQFYKGLKQGDPLSPFLFILIMESLHLSFQRVEDAGMFKGIKLGSSVSISHMFYADDAVFVGQWCESNINTLVHVLECFYRASGLRINMSKSKLMGLHVDSDKVKRAAIKLGCLTFKTPFTYLGSTVGGSMSRIQAWEEVVERVKSRLSKWKMKTLSIGGRLTLLKSVLGSMSIFHMSIFKVPLGVLRKLESIRSHFFNGHDPNCNKASWVNWKMVLAHKDKGGLGVSSLLSLNRV
ncbi:RNA-directed DNA polymerase, eukaryota [Tanacetum coccineum]